MSIAFAMHLRAAPFCNFSAFDLLFVFSLPYFSIFHCKFIALCVARFVVVFIWHLLFLCFSILQGFVSFCFLFIFLVFCFCCLHSVDCLRNYSTHFLCSLLFVVSTLWHSLSHFLGLLTFLAVRRFIYNFENLQNLI